MDVATTVAIVLAVLLAVSEGLAQIPSVKGNSVFQVVYGILKAVAGRKEVAKK